MTTCCDRRQRTPFCAWCGRQLRQPRGPVRRVCASCGRKFVIPAEPHARTDRLYCGNTCRTQAYRRRKRTAVACATYPPVH